MVLSISDTAQSSVNPNPNATTTPAVAAPGRVRLASASRKPGFFGRGNLRSTKPNPNAAMRSTINPPATPQTNHNAKMGEGTISKASAITTNAAQAAASR